VSETTLTFADADPDTTPSISATEGAVSVTVKVRTTGTATLTHQAAGDLVDAAKTIAITNVTWTASGTGFVAGTMDKDTPQSAGSWAGSANETGTLTYSLANSWGYEVGSYAASSTFTLTAP